MKNLTYDQLIELAPKDRPFQIEVEGNPYGKIGKQQLWAFIDIDDNEIVLNTYMFNQEDINNTDYAATWDWRGQYTGTFTLIDPRYQKPEVLKVGQKVRIMESAKDVGYYRASKNSKEITNQIGELNIIDRVLDDDYGIYYETKKGYRFPHYCVQPVEEEEVQEIPELENTLEQLDNLVSKAQDIISKYKK
jgi:hypothetical protein